MKAVAACCLKATKFAHPEASGKGPLGAETSSRLEAKQEEGGGSAVPSKVDKNSEPLAPEGVHQKV